MTNKKAIIYLREAHNDLFQHIPYNDNYHNAIDLAIKALEDRPQGEWYYSYLNGWHCSICHGTVKDMPTVMGKAYFNFCPNCGADMRKGGAK